MSQLVRDLDFGIGSEARRRLAAGTVVVLLILAHDTLLTGKKLTQQAIARGCAYRVPASRFRVKTDYRGRIRSIDAGIEAFSVKIHYSAVGSSYRCSTWSMANPLVRGSSRWLATR
jgi:hypothetical protein